MGFFTREDKKPRIAFREQANGVKQYYVEVWACYESGYMWSQDSKITLSLEDAERELQQRLNTQIVETGFLK